MKKRDNFSPSIIQRFEKGSRSVIVRLRGLQSKSSEQMERFYVLKRSGALSALKITSKYVKQGGFFRVSTPVAQTALLQTLANAFHKISDPRDPRGVRHDFHGMVVIIFLGMLARMNFIAHIQRWAEKHWHFLRGPLGFKRTKPPVETTICRVLAKTSVADLQKVFAEWLNAVLMEDHDVLVAAVDGKAAKQFLDADGNPLLILNVFAHELKVTLTEYSVHGDKTNEPGCLKAHLETLFEQYPFLKLLTGDAIFTQRPLMEALQEYGCDYLFAIKENQGDMLEAAKACFSGVDPDKPDDVTVEKRGPMLKYENCGSTSTTRSSFVNG